MAANPFSTGRLSSFFSPNKIILGPGAVEVVGPEAHALGAKRALLVTDRGVLRTGMAETVKEALASAHVETVLFDRVELETPARVIDEGGALRAGSPMRHPHSPGWGHHSRHD